jgi:putative Holliday junction resolvase
LLAVDVGQKRIGLALSDPSQTLAQPLATLTRRAGRRFPMRRLREHLDAHRPVGVVVGLPLTPDGAEDERAAEARTTGALIAAKTGLPVAYWDERMTTARALGAVRELGGGTRGRKEDVDQLAATVLLQHFLDGRRP